MPKIFWHFEVQILAFWLFEMDPSWKRPNPILQYERTTKRFYYWAYSPFAFEEEFPNLYFFLLFFALGPSAELQCAELKNIIMPSFIQSISNINLKREKVVTNIDSSCSIDCMNNQYSIPRRDSNPPRQSEDCYQSMPLPPSHHGWVFFSDVYFDVTTV